MRNFIRKLMGQKPRYRVKAWNTEHGYGIDRTARNHFSDFRTGWVPLDRLVGQPSMLNVPLGYHLGQGITNKIGVIKPMRQTTFTISGDY